MSKTRVALYGTYGHQIQHALVAHPRAELVAAASCRREDLPPGLPNRDSLPLYDSLEALLEDASVELVSLCSPRRVEQAEHALQCLAAGKHVYAEKPCAMTEEALDALLAAAVQADLVFHEMAGTAFMHPYFAMGQLIASGTIGEVVQVLAQKSYPYHDKRPQEEDVDGGLILQNGVHALRFIEHVTGLQARDVTARQTGTGNPGAGGLMMASTMSMSLENGAIGTAVANYLNSNAFGSWGNEMLRIWGTKGFVEARDGGRQTHLYLNDEDRGPIDTSGPDFDWFEGVLDEIQGTGRMPISLDAELHPTRMVIQARRAAQG